MEEWCGLCKRDKDSCTDTPQRSLCLIRSEEVTISTASQARMIADLAPLAAAVTRLIIQISLETDLTGTDLTGRVNL